MREVNENIAAFTHKFARHLGGTKRWDAFLRIASELFNFHRPVTIGETGSLRILDNWEGDGQSTRLWDFIAKYTNGRAYSIDKSQETHLLVGLNCPNVVSFCDDSLMILPSLEHLVKNFDLLYLDSMDYEPPFALSEIHHAGELAFCYPRLKSGCLIAVDDCHSDFQGKHVFVKAFFDRMGIAPLLKSYITIWKKP